MRNVNTTNALLNVVANRCDRTLDAGLVVACAPSHAPSMRLYPTAPTMSALVFPFGGKAWDLDQGKQIGSLKAGAIHLERIAAGIRERLTQISVGSWQFATRCAQSRGQRRQDRSQSHSPE